MKTKKLLALLMVFVMTMSLAACGGNKAKDTSKEATESPEATATVAPTAAATAEEFPAFDMGGRTIKIGTWWQEYYDSTHTDINDNPAVDNTETAQMMLDRIRWIEKKYNVKIEYQVFDWNGITESINTSIAAGTPECDIYRVDVQFGVPAVAKGLATDIGSIAPDYTDLKNDHTVMTPLDAFGGQYLIQNTSLPIQGTFIGYNKTMIEELGLEDPKELYAKGEWTWDKFAEYCTAATKDKDGDGTMDTYGYAAPQNYTVSPFVLSNGGNIASTETEGLSSPQTEEALEFLSKLYSVDKTAKCFDTVGDNSKEWDDNLNAWTTGDIMFWGTQAWVLSAGVSTATENGEDLAFEYGAVPFPTGPSGDGTPSSIVGGNYFIIPKGVKDADKVYQIFEEFTNWYNYDTELRDDRAWFDSCFLTEEDADMALLAGSKVVPDFWQCMNYNMGDVYLPIIKGDQTVAQAVEANKQILQDTIDSIYGK